MRRPRSRGAFVRPRLTEKILRALRGDGRYGERRSGCGVCKLTLLVLSVVFSLVLLLLVVVLLVLVPVG